MRLAQAKSDKELRRTRSAAQTGGYRAVKQNREKAAGDDRDLLAKNRLDSQTSEAVSAPTQSSMPSSF
jgi:hypothetical protein